MLDFETALAASEARLGVIPPQAADAIARCCLRDGDFDPEALGREGRLAGNPAVALVAALRQRLPAEFARWAHFGATSQDVVDTALMLVLRQVLALVATDLARAGDAAADLAQRYRSTPMTARTLLQHALPTTFGRKAAGWLAALREASTAVDDVRRHRLAVQLGGPAGTLDALGDRGPGVVDELASELALLVPVLPWHTDRTRVVEAAGALAMAAGTAGKIALDVSLLMQTEVGEAFEPPAEGRGGSSSMPHKRNPAMATSVTAAWLRANGLHAIVLGAMAQAHERAAGAWQAEALTLSDLCRAAGGAVSVTADILAGLEVDTARMGDNLGLTKQGGLGERGALQLGSAAAFVDRALDEYRRGRRHE
jgi:3-carboxy-cis,cis-muconate cycloisomerase